MPTNSASKTKTKTKTRTKAKGKAPAKKASSPRATAPSPKQQLLDTFTRESAKTLQLLRAFPAAQSELRPHERSKSARELAWTFVMEQGLLIRALTDQLSLGGGGGPPAAPNDFTTIVNQFERDNKSVEQLIRSTPETKYSTTIKFPTGPGQVGDWTKAAFAWFMISDQIHHRGQFSVYLRMAGGKVPAIYGPSADEPWR
jgi:uncharacterized damage-inducible protein DinB